VIDLYFTKLFLNYTILYESTMESNLKLKDNLQKSNIIYGVELWYYRRPALNQEQGELAEVVVSFIGNDLGV